MSTFSGLIDEILGISIDRFDGLNLNSKIFFLSHCHTDHMIGLAEAKDDLPGSLYLSEVSEVFIRRKFPHLKKLKTLKIGHPTILSIDDAPTNNASDGGETSEKSSKRTFTVTSIPAGHCPGSVMFMFETIDKRVLYTGDFRLDKRAIESIKTFRDCRNDVLSFDCMYIDSTFLLRKYQRFPTQRQSVDAIVELTKNWLCRNEQNVVVVRMPANYGYEFLLSHLAGQFANEVHISSGNAGDYSFLPELDACYSKHVSRNTRIHFQCDPIQSKTWSSRSILCCPELQEKHIRIIRPTAWIWAGWEENTPIYERVDDFVETYRVCYSNHSSFTEIQELIKFINAKSVKFNVQPPENRHEIQAAFNQIVGGEDKGEVKMVSDEADSIPFITFSRIEINSKSRPNQDDDHSSRPKIKRRRKVV